MLRAEFVARKLHLVAEDLTRLSQLRDISYEALVADAMQLAAVERMIERVVLRAVDANEHLIQRHRSSDPSWIDRDRGRLNSKYCRQCEQ